MPPTFRAHLTFGAVLQLDVACVVGTPPARAQARDACRQIAENRAWRDVDTDVRDRVVVTVRGRRDGGDRERECRYDVRHGDAEFDDQG